VDETEKGGAVERSIAAVWRNKTAFVATRQTISIFTFDPTPPHILPFHPIEMPYNMNDRSMTTILGSMTTILEGSWVYFRNY